MGLPGVTRLSLPREDIKVIQELRSAVRKEAAELELQLADLAHHYDQGFRTVITAFVYCG